MAQGKWIWYPGEFEIYHSLLLHSRRYERGVHIPCQWGLPTPYPNVFFDKTFELDRKTTFTVHATAPGVVNVMTGEFPRGRRVSTATGRPVTIGPGRVAVNVQVQKPFGLPAIFIDGEDVFTDETWTANHGLRAMSGGLELPQAACEPAFTRPDDNPEVFPFLYERWDVKEARAENGGVLYDFGRETFGRLHIECADPGAELRVNFGESEAEAFDASPVIFETVSGKASYEFPSFAFRYVFIPGASADLKVWMEYEYLPLENRADFVCDVPEVKKVFDVAAHTFHLNSREFFLDGIKRDRWCWSGDAYQSYMVNNYLFFDQAITRRTIRALLGKPPYENHVNHINDYSLYLIIAVWDYYYATGDLEFVRSVFGRLGMLYDFIHGRLDADGLVCQRPGDWVFIDWARFDREGPPCAEQILLWKAMDAMDRLSALLGAESPVRPGEADALREKVETLYWDGEKGGYIDSFVSGRRNVTRHANIFAVLYDFAPEHVDSIVKNVLTNDAIDAITTPYFKFFELMALCHIGKVEAAQEMILSYWYPMLELGATSIWEQFDPRKEGVAHYEMYGDPFGCSLCHAWGSGPVYLLGRYVAGVRATAAAYEAFEVAPQPGVYRTFKATVPLLNGSVTVEYDADARRLWAVSDRAGGTLRFAGQSVAMEAGRPAEIRW